MNAITFPTQYSARNVLYENQIQLYRIRQANSLLFLMKLGQKNMQEIELDLC